jgi:RimJ/RimL family protein N-acetyltransferase
VPGRPSTPTEAWTRLLRYVGHWHLLGYGYWVVEDRQSAAFLGEVGFADYRRDIEPSFAGRPEAGWVMAPHAHGKGFGREAVLAALAWADAHIRAQQTVCMIAPAHHDTRALASTVGYRQALTTSYLGDEVLIYHRDRSYRRR